jgi:hypothetical protein
MFSERFWACISMPQDHVGDLANGQAPYARTRKLLLAQPQVPIKFATLKQRRWECGVHYYRFMRKDTEPFSKTYANRCIAD